MVEEELKEAKSTQRSRDYPLRLIPYLRCHYCSLELDDVTERKDHELQWHV
jgi:hypothetical protein